MRSRANHGRPGRSGRPRAGFFARVFGRRCAGLALLLAACALPASALAAAAGARGPKSGAQHDPGAVAGTFARAQRAAFGAFAAELAAREALPLHWTLAQLGKARHLAPVRRLIMPPPPGQPKNWQAYRERFVEPERIRAGVAFWRAHERWLERAEAEYGVPPEIVVAVVGVETFYGRVAGRWRVLDALATLAFDFPAGRSDRSAFFRAELEAFLLWCRREGIEATEPRGSYAGAIGLAQFMPSSVQRWGVDFDADGHVDLRGSAPDAVGSVARYLAHFGWQRGLPAYYEVEPPAEPAERAALLAPDIVPSFSAAQFAAHGARLAAPGPGHPGLLALVELDNGGGARSYYAGSTNFYAITRYNWSSYYAMAVIVLAEALKAAR